MSKMQRMPHVGAEGLQGAGPGVRRPGFKSQFCLYLVGWTLRLDTGLRFPPLSPFLPHLSHLP